MTPYVLLAYVTACEPNRGLTVIDLLIMCAVYINSYTETPITIIGCAFSATFRCNIISTLLVLSEHIAIDKN